MRGGRLNETVDVNAHCAEPPVAFHAELDGDRVTSRSVGALLAETPVRSELAHLFQSFQHVVSRKSFDAAVRYRELLTAHGTRHSGPRFLSLADASDASQTEGVDARQRPRIDLFLHAHGALEELV